MYLEDEGVLAKQVSLFPPENPGFSIDLRTRYLVLVSQMTAKATDHDVFAENLSEFNDPDHRLRELTTAYKRLAYQERVLAKQFEEIARLLAERDKIPAP